MSSNALFNCRQRLDTDYDGNLDTTYLPIIDDRGTLIGVANSDGELIEKLYYNSTGVMKSYQADGVENVDANARSKYLPFGWTGMYKDRFTGLYHTHFREYDPIHGRWLSEDPAGYRDGYNLYNAYMGVNGVDATGLDALVMSAAFRLDNNKVKMVSARAIFHEDEFTIPNPLLATPLSLFILGGSLFDIDLFGGSVINEDYEVDIPGKIEFRKDGVFYNFNGHIITAKELLYFALDKGGFQSSEKWIKKIKKQAQKERWGGIGESGALHVRKREEEMHNPDPLRDPKTDPYKRAKNRTDASEQLRGWGDTYFWGMISGLSGIMPVGKVMGAKIGLGLEARSIMDSVMGEILKSSVINPNKPLYVKDQDELISRLEKAGFYDIKKVGTHSVVGKFEIDDDAPY